ncbi:DUF6285 domain-containing protein [Marinobacter sp. ATCH36]|uniref:DUF6285 domain-containing protein n=1 Tax=Marinobacter sp. ATCH36 TaxID=2945106 RepID=UPI002020965F|nr:DUF6285 domain-containing protein [Marinobacter sp. ATCH36]MCL7945477.1 DUSAM domain-containing protein [Marinobacter sp. ATCH36]
MINQPESRDLLTEARQVLLDSVAPELAGERKYQALMIANAMGMAIRELEQREQGEPEETDQTVRAFLAERSLAVTSEEAEPALARVIRERGLDGADPALRAVLRRLTEARLRINNPGYLKP